ncbi:MAG: putative Na+/H+ antiporter [Chlamydiales bacterium]
MTFQIISTMIFFLAILHTFLTPALLSYSRKIAKLKDIYPQKWNLYHFLSEVLYLLSEVEVVFGLWLFPLLIAFTWLKGWDETLHYLNTRQYTHAIYITVILVVIGSRPIITFAENILESIARLGKDSPAAWWWSILTISPLIGALIKEPAAMALSAILLSKKFYPYGPSRNFSYATLGLLFANISVGGMLTSFSSRALFIVANKWDWSWSYMFTRFGWKGMLGIFISTSLYYLFFRHEFKSRRFPKILVPLKKKETRSTPLWITLIHLCFLVLIVITGEITLIFLGIFLLFLGFWKATTFYQTPLHLQSAVLVGFFFASLIIHGELQSWWIIPLMQNLNYFGAMGVSFLLSAFMDNAVISYITLELPKYDDLKHYLVIVGAMSAGSLTVIANAPNPVGHALLRGSFNGKISFFFLFLGGVMPALIYLFLFWIFQ